MSTSRKIESIEKQLEEQKYTPAARECLILIEGGLRDILINKTKELGEQAQQQVRAEEQKLAKGSRGKSFKDFTLGQLINILIDSDFFEEWAKVSQRKLTHLIDLKRLNKLRTELFHAEGWETREVSQYEAETLFAFLKELHHHYFDVDESRSELQPLRKILPTPVEIPAKTMQTFSLGQLCARRSMGYVWFALTFTFAYCIPVMIDLLMWFTTNHSQQLLLFESELLIFLMAITCAIVTDNFIFETKPPSGWIEKLLYTLLPTLIIIFCVLIYVIGYIRLDNLLVITSMFIVESVILFMVVCYVALIKHEQLSKCT